MSTVLQKPRPLDPDDELEAEHVDVKRLCRDCRSVDYKTTLRFTEACNENRFAGNLPEVPLTLLSNMQPRVDCPLCQLFVKLAESVWGDEFDHSHTNFKDRTKFLSYCWRTRAGLVCLKQALGIGFQPIILIMVREVANKNIVHHFGKFLLYKDAKEPSRLRRMLSSRDSKNRKYGLPPVATTVSKSFKLGITEVNLSLIRSWLETCTREHHDTCNPHGRRVEVMNFTLIDVVAKKLVRTTTKERYVALSYVWGRAPGFRTLSPYREELERDGAFDRSEYRVSTVIEDAMHLVRALGETYLWVDCLSICQDDQKEKHSQIARMDIIYSQAYLTICAAAGESANSHLAHPGPMILPPLKVQGVRFVPKQDTRFHSAITHSLYERRAWTLQERSLSTRCLFFTKHGMVYFCGKGTFCREDDPTGFHQYRELSARLGSLHNLSSVRKWSDPNAFVNYNTIVSDYTSRQLSYPADILSAFAGITAVFARRCGGGFVQGLPEAVIDFALLWSPSTPAIKPRKIGSASDNVESPFPSWSFSGWVGPVSFPLLNLVQKQPFTGFRSLIDEFYIEQAGAIRLTERSGEYEITSVQREGRQPHRGLLHLSRPALHFSANAVPAKKFSFTIKQDTTQAEKSLFGDRNLFPENTLLVSSKEIGYMFSFDENIEDQLRDPEFEFIALAQLQGQGKYDPNHTIAMLVEKKGEYYERRAIAMIEEEVWNFRSPKLKYIRLA